MKKYTCRKCGSHEYYGWTNSKGRLLRRCVACQKAYARSHYFTYRTRTGKSRTPKEFTCKKCGSHSFKTYKRLNGMIQRKCPTCAIANARSWEKAHPERTKIHQRTSFLRGKYGLERSQFSKMMKTQDFKCAICHKPIIENHRIDHNHATGKVRALLCNACNSGLGFFKDSTDLLKKAVIYLDSFA